MVRFRTLSAGLLVLAASLAFHRTVSAHPLHTSMADVRYSTRQGSLRVLLRVFMDDFRNASIAHRDAQRARGVRSRVVSPLVDYALASFRIYEAGGKMVALQSCGGKRVGDLLWLCFQAELPQKPRGLKVHSALMFEMFSDQINIVKTAINRKESNLLFTPGDGPKAF